LDFERSGGRRQRRLIGPAAAGPLCRCLATTLAFISPASLASGQQAQSPVAAGDWNSAHVRELASRAIDRRSSWTGDEELNDYRGKARGHIYFLYDLGRSTERHLVKADQLALDLYWHAPDQTRQVIVGRREQKALPTNIRYHLDHLTVVMDNFGDMIRLGEGSEVQDALHPAAPGALEFYDYRLADSLTLLLPDREVRVYKLEVRPHDSSGPGLVGAVYLDRSLADIVRMDFTFTSASYLDETLDYFNIRLENALWQGRYWLPYRQGIELRREIKAFKFPAGGIIRAEFKISDYEFNAGTPAAFFRGPSVTSLPAAQRETFVFEDGLYDALDPSVAVTPPSMEAIRTEAARLVAASQLQRLERLRFALPGFSSVLRFRRAEGLYAGAGIGRTFQAGSSTILLGGYALGSDRWEAAGQTDLAIPGWFDARLEGYWNRVADAAPWARSSGAIATLATLIDGEDYREPYWSSGGILTLSRPWGGGRVFLSLAWEDWEAADLDAARLIDRAYRDVRWLDEGEVGWLALEFKRTAAAAVEKVGGLAWSGRVEGAARTLVGDFDFLRATLRTERLWPDLLSSVDVRLSGSAGVVGGGRVPAQRLFALGGRGTVRGYGYDTFVGNVYGTFGLELSREIRYPLLSLKLFGDVGWVGSEGDHVSRALSVWNLSGSEAGPTRGPLIGVGAGFGFLFDILQIELARGVRQGGIWELIVRIRSELWEWL